MNRPKKTLSNTKKEKKQNFLCIWLLLAGFCTAALLVLVLCMHYASTLPDTVGRTLTAAEEAEIKGRNSPLTDYIFLSPNANFPRENTIQKITIHHMGGNLSLKALGESFSQQDRRASSNYAIDSNGNVALYVEETNRAWTSSSRENDHQAVTIEVANDETGGDWHVSDKAYNALIELCVDICRRNGIGELRFTGDVDGNLTIHKMFSDQTECPGAYLEGKMGEIAQEVNKQLNGT